MPVSCKIMSSSLAHAVCAPLRCCCSLFRYKKLWDQDKDAYIRRYEKANKPLSSYELDIKEYLNKEVGAYLCSLAALYFAFCRQQGRLTACVLPQQ